jgi:hypothetical protein
MWKTIPLHSKRTYEIDDHGNIRTGVRKKPVKVVLSNGYASVWLCVDVVRPWGKWQTGVRQFFVHKLVAVVFLDGASDWSTFRACWYSSRRVYHKNKKKLDNRAANLVWREVKRAEGH